MIAILHAIERHTSALEARPDLRSEESWLTRYRRHLTEHHGLIDPPDFDRRRRVPIADLYVPPTIIPMVETDPDLPPPEIDLWVLDEEIDRTVLLGDPGAGKTTTANVLTHHHAQGTKVPFLVTLREYAAQDPPEFSVAAFIEHKLDRFYQCPAPPGLIARLLLSGRALVVFDGLDELVDTARRADVTAVIERFCTEYPLTRVLVTSRLVGYDQARLDDRQFTRYRIGSFTDDHVAEYVRKWFALDQGVPMDEAESFLQESAAVPDLRANPLMLALMCILYRGEGSLPRNRAEVYEQCAKLLFHKWDARRRIHRDLRAGHLVEPALRHLAHWLFTREGEPAVTERELIEETTTVLREHGFGPDAAEEFVEFCRGRMWVFSDVGTTASGRPLYAFTHRTFMEYFTAAHLAYTSDTPEQLARALAPHVARHEWEVVGELAVQIKDHTSRQGAERIYKVLLGDRRHRSVRARSAILQFLARCLRSVSPTPATVRALTEQVLDHFFAGDPNDEVRYLPLSRLLAGCRSGPEPVDEVISARVAKMVGSSDPATNLNGLRLALHLHFGAARQGNDPLVRFWTDRVQLYVRAYEPHILAAATYDRGILQRAHGFGLLTIEQILAMPGGLESALEYTHLGIFDIHEDSLIGEALRQNCINDLATIGNHLLQRPEPPFIVSEPSLLTTSPHHRGLNTAAYLGVTMCLLISAVTVAEVGLQDPQQLDRLSNLLPYMQRRWGFVSDDDFPDMPLPPRFQRLILDWGEPRGRFHGDASGGGVV